MPNPKVSVLTPTIRGMQGLYRPGFGLARQTFRDFEWIYEEHEPSSPPDFNACMNRLIRRASGDIIVFLQDFIFPYDLGLDKFVQAIEKNPKTFFTAPVGKTLIHDYLPNDVSWDWRKYRDAGEDLEYVEWEIDWAAAPRQALIDIGGFDEELDKHWGFDNVNLALRAKEAGYKFQNLPFSWAIALDHNEIIDHPYQKFRNPDFHNMRLGQIIRGEVQVKYL